MYVAYVLSICKVERELDLGVFSVTWVDSLPCTTSLVLVKGYVISRQGFRPRG